jgi:hypothetical protein
VTREDAGIFPRISGGVPCFEPDKLRYMKIVRALPQSSAMFALLLAGLTAVCSPAQAGMQWKWRDASGAIQYSDRPPPAGTPEQSILSKPLAARTASRTPEPASAASAPPAPAAAKASDPELEARRKKAEDDKAAKQKADEEKLTKQKAENCQRAQAYQRSLQDGQRIMRTNSKGEREVLDDKARADEAQRAQEAIQSNCK